MVKSISIESGDALLIIDIQNDFLPGGSLAVRGGEQVIPVINRCIEKFDALGHPLFLTRDWHPEDHSSFIDQGGPWPPHCVAGSHGAEFSPELRLPERLEIFSTGYRQECAGYSGFEETELLDKLESLGIRRLFVAGLATDYCVLHTVLDALGHGYQVYLLQDAVRAVNLQAGDGDKALQSMRENGAEMISSDMIL